MGNTPLQLHDPGTRVAATLVSRAGIVATILPSHPSNLVRKPFGIKLVLMEEPTSLATNDPPIFFQARGPRMSTNLYSVSKPALQHRIAFTLCLPALKGFLHWELLWMLGPSLLPIALRVRMLFDLLSSASQSPRATPCR